MGKEYQASRYRQRILGLTQHLSRLTQQMQGRTEMLKGSFYARRRQCGKPSCRCRRGKLHQSMALAIRRNKQSRLVSLAGMDPAQLTELTGAYKRFRRTRAELVTTFRQLLQAVDGLGRLREVRLPNSSLVG